jgi:hypothetical protein
MSSHPPKWIPRFTAVVALILLLGAVGKTDALIAGAGFVSRQDPVFHVPKQWVFLCVVPLEMVAAAYLVFSGSLERRLALCTAGGMLFLCYRTVAAFVSPFIPCDCFGSILSRLGLSAAMADDIASVAVVAVCGVSTLAWVLWKWPGGDEIAAARRA